MTTRKDLIIAVLATFCLTATLFVVIPIGGLPAYDPWKDLNDDGVIDGQDFQMVKGSIPSLGEPTKNVNVRHSTYEWESPEITLAPGSACSILNSTNGYGAVTITIREGLANWPVRVQILEGSNGNFFTVDTWYVQPIFTNARTYPVKAPYIWVIVTNLAQGNVSVNLSVYMTTAEYVEAAETAWETSASYGSFNVSWTENSSTGGGGGIAQFAGGYSTLFVYLKITNISETGYWPNQTVSVRLASIAWTDFNENWDESISSDVLNITTDQYYGGTLASGVSKPLSVKGPYFWLFFSVNCGEACAIPSGWAIIEFYYYLRNN